MNLIELTVMYGHLGEGVSFARDPSGYLSLEAGIFQKHGLAVSWEYVQGPEERYRRLANGTGHISLVVGRSSLRNFLSRKTTRIIGCAMNACPYYLLAAAAIGKLADLRGKAIAGCVGPLRNAPVAETFLELAQLRLGQDLELRLLDSDEDVFNALMERKVPAALFPRPYGFFAEERGFRRVREWPDVVDEGLPITLETTEALQRERGRDFSLFLEAHREGIAHLKANRTDAIRMLVRVFGLSPAVAGKTFDEYIPWMDERLTVDFRHLEKLVAQAAPDIPGGAKKVASEWIVPGGLRV